MTETIYVDGSCSKDGVMRVALVHNRYQIVKYAGRGNSNIAEYKSLIAALRYINRKKLSDVTILSDFLSLVDQMSGNAKVHSHAMRFYFEQATQMIGQCENINIPHVQRNYNLAGKLF